MVRRVAYLTAVIGLGLTVAGCLGYPSFERRANWRDAEERACLRQQEVTASAWIERASKINGKGACGVDKPLKVRALADGTINVGPDATINCPMTVALEGWIQEAVQPAALAWFGQPVSEIKQISAYYCRTKNSKHGASLSEHAFGNALDISAFVLIDGRTVTVLKGWNGKKDESSFLREVFAHGCKHFKTALGPGVQYHADHFHFDLARHNAEGTSRYCRPTPDPNPPVRPPFGGYMIASQQPHPGLTEPGLAQATYDQGRLAQVGYGQPVYSRPEYGRPAYGQAGDGYGAGVPPVYGGPDYRQPGPAPADPFPPVAAEPRYPPAGGPSPEYPEPDGTFGRLPDSTYWPRRLPPAEVPMGYAPQ